MHIFTQNECLIHQNTPSQMIKAMNNQIDDVHKSSQMIKVIINMIGEDN